MSNRVRRLGVVALVLAGTLVAAAAASAQTDADADAHAVAPLAEQYCFRCHGPQTQTAGINLATLVTERPLVRNRETWERIIEALDAGEMPPAGAPPLPPEVRRRMAAMLHRDIEEFDYSTLDDPGFELMRRLTHTEYDNTIRDLFGVALNVTDRFPDELTGSSGFDNSSNTLFLQPALMERYIAAAERVVELALPAEPTDVRHLASRELIFVAEPGGEIGDEDAAEAVLQRFLGRAYRRPATAGEVEQAVDRYRIGRAAGLDHEVGGQAGAAVGPDLAEVPAEGRAGPRGRRRLPGRRLGARLAPVVLPVGLDARPGALRPRGGRGAERPRRRCGRRSPACSPTGGPTPWGRCSRRSGSASSTSAPASGSTPSTIRGAPRR